MKGNLLHTLRRRVRRLHLRGRPRRTRRQHARRNRRHYGLPDWEIIKSNFKDVLILHLFKRFAEVETIPSKPFKKVPLPKGESLLVDSQIPFTYTDCSWFRTIVRSEGFMVKGHFRLQPYKNGKRLIYIQPFQKHGYTR